MQTITNEMAQPVFHAATERAAILVVEDEPAIMELISFTLRAAGWQVYQAGNVAQSWEILTKRTPDLILLDWMLPGQSGLQLLARLRSDFNFKTIPVIMLTAKGLEEDKVAGLERGADDYVIKPFSPRELTARVHALLRRNRPEMSEAMMAVGPVTLDVKNFSVYIDHQRTDIGLTEFKLLRFFLSKPNKVFSRAQLLDRVWGLNADIEERTIDVHILRLRKALRNASTMIKTVRGVGYMLTEK